MKNPLLVLSLVALGSAGFALADASTASITVPGGVESSGLSNSAVLTLSYDPNTQLLSVTIQNTSQTSANITAFALNLMSNQGALNIVQSISPDPWNILFNYGNLKIPTQPSIGFGTTTGPDSMGESPNQGIAPGESLTFQFKMDENVALAAIAALNTANAGGVSVYLRFSEGGAGGGSGGAVAATPEPASLILFSTGLLAGGAYLRRKYRGSLESE